MKPSALGFVIGRGELDNSLPGSLLTFNAVEGYYRALTFLFGLSSCSECFVCPLSKKIGDSISFLFFT